MEITAVGATARKFFNLSERCERWRDYRVDLTQDEIEAHPAQRAFGSQADHHPPLPDWLATPVCSEDGRPYGLLQPSGKAGGADFTEEDADNIRDLAAFAGATLDALRAARGAARSHF